MTAEVTVWGIPLPLGAALVARAFELWTHENDIRRVAGLAASVPDASTLRLMTELATSMLPFGAMLAGLQGPINLRLVLTGPGGGTWDVVVGGDAPEPATIAHRHRRGRFLPPGREPARPRRPRHACHR